MKQTLISIILCILFHGFTIGQEIHFTKVYSIENGLKDRSQRRVISDEEGKTWIISDRNFQLYTGIDFIDISIDLDIDLDDIYKIKLINNHRIALLGEKDSYLLHTRKKKIEKIIHSPGNPYIIYKGDLVKFNTVSGNYKDLNLGKKWIYKNFMDTSFIGLTEQNYLWSLDNQRAVEIQDSVSMVLGYIRQNLYYIRNNIVHKYSEKEGVVNTGLKYRSGIIRKDSKENYLLGLSNDTRRIQKFILFDGLEEKDYSFLKDHTNTIRDFQSADFTQEILLATYNGLIYHNFSDHITRIMSKEVKEGKFGNIIWWTIYRKKEKEIYFAKEGQGVFRYKKDSLTQMFPTTKHPKVFRANYYGHYDEDDDLLYASSFGSGGNDLWIWDFNSSPIKIKSSIRITSFLKINSSQLLLSGSSNKNGSLAIFDIKKREITTIKEFPSLGKNIYSLTANKAQYYISAHKGFYKMESNNEDSFDLNKVRIDTLLNISPLDHKTLGNISIAGTYGKGVYIFKNDTLHKHLTLKDGLVDDLVVTVGVDDNRNIWLTTLNGISVLDSDYNVIKNIRKENGLSSNDFNMHSFSTTEDAVYFGGINGINRISYDILENRIKQPMNLNSITYKLKGVKFTTQIHDIKDIVIPYEVDTCILNFLPYSAYQSFFTQDHIINNEFTDCNKKSIPIDKTSISFLSNECRTITQKSFGLEPKIIEFKKQNFSSRYGMQVAMIFIVLLLAFLLWSYHQRKQEDKNKELNLLKYKLTNMRSKALRSQMNPHFIFNALGSIQYHIQKENSELAEEYLSDFAYLMRRILESSREDFVNLNEELEMLKLYVKLEHLRFDQKFDYRFTVSKELDIMQKLPSMIIQPYVENAINHGIYHLRNRKGKIEINFRETGSGGISCIIKDNGIGRQASQKWKNKKHKSRGMEIIKERLAILSKTHDQNFKVEVQDLKTNDRPLGTRVVVFFNS